MRTFNKQAYEWGPQSCQNFWGSQTKNQFILSRQLGIAQTNFRHKLSLYSGRTCRKKAGQSAASEKSGLNQSREIFTSHKPQAFWLMRYISRWVRANEVIKLKAVSQPIPKAFKLFQFLLIFINYAGIWPKILVKKRQCSLNILSFLLIYWKGQLNT